MWRGWELKNNGGLSEFHTTKKRGIEKEGRSAEIISGRVLIVLRWMGRLLDKFGSYHPPPLVFFHLPPPSAERA